MSEATPPAAPAKKPKVPKAKPAKAAAAKVTVEPKPKREKPSKVRVAYSQAIADEIAVRTSIGESLRTIAADKTMPSVRSMTKWQRAYPDFAAQLDRARVARADSRIEKISDLANQVEAGTLDPNAGRVAIDAQKFLAEREHW